MWPPFLFGIVNKRLNIQPIGQFQVNGTASGHKWIHKIIIVVNQEQIG